MLSYETGHRGPVCNDQDVFGWGNRQRASDFGFDTARHLVGRFVSIDDACRGDSKNLCMLSWNSSCGRNRVGRRCSRKFSLTENPILRLNPIRSAVFNVLVSGLDSKIAGRNRFSSGARVSQRLIPSALSAHSEAGRSGSTSGTECLIRTTILSISLNANLHGPGTVLITTIA